MGILCSAPAGHPQLWTNGIGGMQSHPGYESFSIYAISESHFSAQVSSRSKVGAVLHMARQAVLCDRTEQRVKNPGAETEEPRWLHLHVCRSVSDRKLGLKLFGTSLQSS